jgi:hypothetical protein
MSIHSESLYLSDCEKAQLSRCGGKCRGCIHSGECEIRERIDEPGVKERSFNYD